MLDQGVDLAPSREVSFTAVRIVKAACRAFRCVHKCMADRSRPMSRTVLIENVQSTVIAPLYINVTPSDQEFGTFLPVLVVICSAWADCRRVQSQQPADSKLYD